MNKFYKVSLEQYIKDTNNNDEASKNEWEDIKLPHRATSYSAGYDFYTPFDFELKPNETIKIPTGIKVELNKRNVLLITPRSSLGFKYRLQLDNTVGVIDSDYFNNKNNEGHIFIKITNDSNTGKNLSVKKGEAFAQGIIVQYFLTDDDDSHFAREGGIGSTNGK